MAEPKQFTKSVLLSGGPADHVPEYLREQPTLDYVENGRFEKKDTISKALPYKSQSQTNLPIADDPPIIGFGARGSRLVALDRFGKVYDKALTDSEWSVHSTNVIPTKNTLLSRQAVPGGRHADAVVQNGYTVIAWDTYDMREDATLPDVTMGFVVRDPEGQLVQRVDIANACHPKLVKSALNNLVFLYYLRPSTGDIEHYFIDSSDGSIASSGLTLSGSIYDDLPWVARANANFEPQPAPYSADNKTKRPSWRTPYIADGGKSGYFDVAFSPDGSEGAILYNTGITDTAYIRLNGFGVTTGSPVSVTTVVSTTEAHVPLAVAVDDDSNVCCCVNRYQTDYTATDGSTVVLRRYNAANTRTTNVLKSYDGIYVYNATLAPENTSDNFMYALGIADQEPYIERAKSINTHPTVEWGELDAVDTDDSRGALQHYRIASKGAYFADGEDAGMGIVLQKYVGSGDPGGENERDLVVRSLLYNTPVTSVLVMLHRDSDDTYKVISTFDAGQSNQTPGSSKEQAMYLPSLNYSDSGDSPVIAFEGKFEYCNRVAQEPEDTAMYQTYTDNANQDKRKAVLNPGQAEYRVWEAKRDVAVQAQEYGDVVVFSTGCPTLWDGDVLMELAPFDPPEMIYYTSIGATGNPPNHIYHELTHGDIDEWRQCTATINFVDGGNNLHRSAPGIIHWIEGMEIQDQAGPSSQVILTRPLSAVRANFKNFFEVYVGIGSNPPQLVDTQFISADHGGVAGGGGGVTASPRAIFTDRIQAGGTLEEVSRNAKAVYTEGELAADVFPSFSDFTIGAQRMAAISGAETGVVFMSKLITGGVFPEFHGTLSIEVGRNRTLTAIEELDEKFIVFSKDEIFVISNTGPDNTGANGDFFVDRLQTTVGCDDPESVIKTPDGLIFFSGQSKTFWLLSRDLQLIEVGQPIEDLTEDVTDVWGSVWYADENEVRFYVTGTIGQENGPDPNTDAGVPTRPPRPRYKNVLPATTCCLVYNYEYKKWTVNTLPGVGTPTLATSVNGTPAYITDDWEVYVGDDWSDDVEANIDVDQRLKIRLSWLRSNTLQAFSRYDELQFLGKYFSSWTKDASNNLAAGDVQVKLYYDYAAEADDTYRFRANVPDNLGTNRMQFSVHPGQPRAQSVQVELEEVATTAIQISEPSYRLGRGWAIHGLDIVFTPKSGGGIKTSPQRSRE